MKKMSMSMEVEFPPEMTISILSRLPEESILECKCVCKTWETLIHDSLFLATYIARQSFSAGDGDGDGNGYCIMGHQEDIGYGSAVIHYGETININAAASGGGACFKVTKPTKSPHKWFKEDIIAQWNLIGSSNGLICLCACLPRYEKYTYTIYVYNPMTKEYVNLGPQTFAARQRNYGGPREEDVGYRAIGFGYHPSTKEYKVIIINYRTRCSPGQVKVYTLGGSRWRDKGEIPYVFTTLYYPGVLVNGALHWLTKDPKIVCFDLADEVFREVPVPPGINLSKHDLLGTLGGRLCVYVSNSVWVLKEYMMGESWAKIFSRKNVYEPLEEEDVGLRIFGGTFLSHFRSERRKFVSYDSESGSISIVPTTSIEWFNEYSRLNIVSYRKSFVSLKALGEEDVQYDAMIR